MTLPHRRQHRNAQQHTLLEYASLKHTCPEGIYISLKPGSPAQWSGVLFVRKGSYAPAILRFDITYPSTYPTLPPSITFISDIFHPLVTPLTTYTYSTGTLSSDTVSASDEERLPPGGFSFRHRFPHWFGRAEKSVASSNLSSRNVSGSQDGQERSQQDTINHVTHAHGTSSSRISSRGAQAHSVRCAISQSQHLESSIRTTHIVEVLRYMKSAFDDESTMDALPLEAAGNPGAWKAWRAHRQNTLRALYLGEDGSGGSEEASLPGNDDDPNEILRSTSKQPGEWNWDGVWHERVRKGIDASISSSVLYGASGGGDDLIRFIDADDDLIESIRKTVLIITPDK